MSPTLRRYEPDDCAACWLLFYRAVQIGAAGHYDQAQRDVWCAAPPAPTPERNARLAEATTWLAEDEGRLIGFMSLENDGHLDMAFVDPDYMGQGVARALHDRTMQSARDADLTQLKTEASLLAERFFTRQGWQVTAPDTVKRGGVSLPRYLMQITLKEPV
jgi:putative acetyltransferase